MANVSFMVTPGQLRAKAQELESLNKTLRAKIADLENQENSLNSMWEGEAKDAFHTAFNNDKIQMNNFATQIDAYVNALNKAAEQYEMAENKNVVLASNRSYK